MINDLATMNRDVFPCMGSKYCISLILIRLLFRFHARSLRTNVKAWKSIGNDIYQYICNRPARSSSDSLDLPEDRLWKG